MDFTLRVGGFLAGRGDKISISGARPTSNVFLLDGINANDLYNRTPGSTAGVFPEVETVREFSVLTNSYSAEYGRGAGGVINAVTKPGTNEKDRTFFFAAYEGLRQRWSLYALNIWPMQLARPTIPATQA